MVVCRNSEICKDWYKVFKIDTRGGSPKFEILLHQHFFTLSTSDQWSYNINIGPSARGGHVVVQLLYIRNVSKEMEQD